MRELTRDEVVERAAKSRAAGRGTGESLALTLAVCFVLGAQVTTLGVPPDMDDDTSPTPRTTSPAPRTGSTETVAPERQPRQQAESNAGAATAARPASGRSGTTGANGAAIAFPHPLITEVLYAVPSGAAGDANGDGDRSVNGDEFVELVNPHDEAIDVGGYALTDATSGTNQFKFVFPALTLKPGEVAVVFNGCQVKWSDDSFIGSSQSAPGAASPASAGFRGAWIFSAKAARSGVGFANESDAVVLSAPDGSVLQRVWWGVDAPESIGALIDEQAPSVSQSSVQRDSTRSTGSFRDHRSVGVPPGVTRKQFSPGWAGDRSASRPAPLPAAPATQETDAADADPSQAGQP